MDVAGVVSTAFAALSVGALLFFAHKVAWLVRYKRLQRELLTAADRRIEDERRGALPDWEAFAVKAWRVARGPQASSEAGGAHDYVKAVEHELGSRVEAMDHPVALAPRMEAAVREPGLITHTVFEVPLRNGTTAGVRIRLEEATALEPERPGEELFRLDVRSRYGFWRRMLVFVTGLADVVYSSSHIAKMSHYTHVSMGTILRRMSLVILLVLGIVLEVVVGLRAALERWLEGQGIGEASWAKMLPAAAQDNLASLTALVLWTVGVAGLYFGLFFFVRAKSKRHLRDLADLEARTDERLAAIEARHRGRLAEWARQYGATLDQAVDLTRRHVELLAKHYAARVRRRMCGAPLVEVAQVIGKALFARLPEASDTLQDTITTRERSFRHAIWPRREEMEDVVEQAQLRQAWQAIELSLGELRRAQPDPDQVAEFWTQLVTLCATFSGVVPSDIDKQLRRAYLALVEETSLATEADLERFDASVRELCHNLNQQLAAAGPLLSTRNELANQRIAADAARLQSEIVRTREAARLEAMAFEI